MKKSRQFLNFYRYSLIVLTIIFCLLFLYSPLKVAFSFAEDSSSERYYSSPLEDLSTAENFDKDSYEVVPGDYRPYVINLAENKYNELILYVYQPDFEKNIVATSVNISQSSPEEDPFFTNYKLTLVSQTGVFQKYRVENIYILNLQLHYYNISSIFRRWTKDLDSETGNDNEISEVAYPVAQFWSVAINEDNSKDYFFTETNVVTITDKYVGFIRNYDSVQYAALDVHFVAFSCDYLIEDLVEADVSFVTRDVEYEKNNYSLDLNDSEKWAYGENSQNQVGLLSDTYKTVEVGKWFFKKQYSWPEIEKCEDFMSEHNLISSASENLKNKQWVLNFYSTAYKEWNDTVGAVVYTEHRKYTSVREVTILRLKFVSQGVQYNLGVVDNKQSGDLIPDNVIPQLIPWWVRLLIIIGIVLVIFIFLIIFFPSLVAMIFKILWKIILFVLKILWKVICSIFKFLWWLICLPFRYIRDKRSKK